MTISREQFDVAIVGAGPAGSSLAIRLADAGLKIALAEQKKFPRHKLCGEFVSPECNSHFAELRLAETIAASMPASLRETVFYTYAGRSVSIRSEVFAGNAEATGLSRATMDKLLLERARAVGVRVFDETSAFQVLMADGIVTGLELRNAEGKKIDISSRVAVDATGRSRILVRKVLSIASERPALTAFKTYLSGADPDPDICEIYSYPDGYGGLNSVGDAFNVCFIVDSRKVRELGNDPQMLMSKLVMRNPRAAKTLANAKPVEPWLAVAIDRFGTVEPAPVEGLIAIGDAASFIDPFTGSGILMALESSRVAANAIKGAISDTQQLRTQYLAAYRDKFSQRLRYSNILRYASTSTRVAEIAVAALRSSSFLRTRVARYTRA